MQSPFIIGLLSFIPGLGFFALGKPRRGLGAIGIIFGLLSVSIFIQSGFIAELCFLLAIFAWVGQIVLAAQSAKLLQKQQAGESTAPRETTKIAPPPSGLSLKERGAYKIREVVRQQLNTGEELLEAVVAQTKLSVGSLAAFGALSYLKMKQYYVGLTKESLIMIELDMLGKPSDIKRIPLDGIKSSKYKKKLLTDELILDFGEKQPMKLQVTSGLRKQTLAFFEILQNLNAG